MSKYIVKLQEEGLNNFIDYIYGIYPQDHSKNIYSVWFFFIIIITFSLTDMCLKFEDHHSLVILI